MKPERRKLAEQGRRWWKEEERRGEKGNQGKE